nr:hypothetical protein [Tanacetum cinerariifolium]
MQTRSSSRLVSDQSSNPTSSTNPNLKGCNHGRSKQTVENYNLEENFPPVVTMADQCTMAQLLQAPTEGYEDAIVVPAITSNNFELKHGPLTLVLNKQFFRHDKENMHAHICYFNKITSTLKFPNVPNTSIKLMPFPFSLEGAAWIWLEKEPPRSILNWDDLVSKFINQFFPLSKTTSLHQDSLNSAAGGNFLDKMPYFCLSIIESKSKVHYSCGKPVVAKVSTNASTSGVSPDVAELKDMVRALLLDKKGQNQSPAPVKAVEERCKKREAAAEKIALLLMSKRNCQSKSDDSYAKYKEYKWVYCLERGEGRNMKQGKRIAIYHMGLRIYKDKKMWAFVGNKMHKAFPLPVTDFPLPGEVPTASEESSHYLKKRTATAVKIALLL